MKSRRFTLYGLKNHRAVVDEVISDLGSSEADCFDIRLVITEALSNAFIHGNKMDDTKPIRLKYYIDDGKLTIEVEDSGCGLALESIPRRIDDDTLLDEHGRGLFLISCYSDKVTVKDNMLVIEKHIQSLNS